MNNLTETFLETFPEKQSENFTVTFDYCLILVMVAKLPSARSDTPKVTPERGLKGSNNFQTLMSWRVSRRFEAVCAFAAAAEADPG
jgi:hypothetical protein